MRPQSLAIILVKAVESGAGLLDVSMATLDAEKQQRRSAYYVKSMK